MLPLLLSAAFAAEPPNVLVIIADDLGADKVSSYAGDRDGYAATAKYIPQTGVIDDLGRAGLRFTDAWANPTCSPTRAAFQTGRYSFRTGVGMPVPMGPALDPRTETTLAEALSARGVGDADGYSTGLFGKWHLGTEGARGETDWSSTGTSRTVSDNANPLRFGYQYFDGFLEGQVEDYHRWTRVTSDGSGKSTVTTETKYATDVITKSASQWIQKQKGPWFAVASFNAPHTSGDTRTFRPEDLDPGCPPLRPEATGATAELAIYQSLAECLDTRIGELLHSVPTEVMQNTIIVVFGDNGTEKQVVEADFAQLGDRKDNAKTTAYQTGVHVPFVVTDGKNWLQLQSCSPDQRQNGTCGLTNTHVTSPGRTVSAPVGVVDLFATVAGLAGTKASTAVDSVSFLGCLTGTQANCNGRGGDNGKPLYTESFKEMSAGRLASATAGLRQGDYKLVAKYQPQSQCIRYELFDLAADPLEWRNLAETDPTHLSDLRNELSSMAVPWVSTYPACPPGTEDAGAGRRPGGGGGGGGGGMGPRGPRR